MAQTKQPNILVFFTDDHGQWAAGCYGNSELHTPTMNYIAETGARMDQAYTPCPVCSPARASFWTGRIPSMHGVHDYIQEPGSGSSHPGIIGQPNLAQHLQSAGYQTGLTGKWHCQAPWEVQPGFDFWFSMTCGTNARFAEQTFNDNGTEVKQFGHQAPMITDAALRYIQQRDAEKPMFLFVGYTDTHSPHAMSPERLVSRYRHCSFRDVPEEQFISAHGSPKAPKPDDADQHREYLAQYYAAVTMIDEQMGRIIDELDSLGELDNTLIIYTSDHGHMNGHHGLYYKGNSTTPQNLLDESVRVPCLLRWPEYINAGQSTDMFVDHCDTYATVLDAAGVTLDDNLKQSINSPGRSYLPALCGKQSNWRDEQYCEYGNARMIRTKTHKLIRRYPGPNGTWPDEFYDLVNDPREQTNSFDQPANAQLIEQMTAKLDQYFGRYEDPNKSGRDIARQPICNPVEPWVRDPSYQ